MIPDAPYIREAERDGMPPFDEPNTTCPVCGKECETIYADLNGDAVGCDECLTLWDSAEWNDGQKQKEGDAI